MEKFIVYFSDNTFQYVWSTDKNMAKFHLQPYAIKHKLSITKVEKYKAKAAA